VDPLARERGGSGRSLRAAASAPKDRRRIGTIRSVDPDDHVALLPTGLLRYAGVVAVAVLWTTVTVGMHRTGLRVADERPISYLGTVSDAVQLFRVGLIAAAGLLCGFAWAVHRRLARSTGFLTVFLLGMGCQAVVAVVPLTGDGASRPIHVAAGIALGLSLPLLMWRFAVAQERGRWRAVAFGLMWLEVAACVAGVALSRAGRATFAEAVPAALFHLWIIVVTFRWPAWRALPAPASVGSAGRSE